MTALLPPRTQVTPRPDGPRRRRLTFDDVLRMFETGVLARDERVELIDGEIMVMAAKGNRHEIVRDELDHFLKDNRPSDIRVSTETPLRLSDVSSPEPDFLLYLATMRAPQVDGTTALLVIEVADSSLGYDLGVKSAVYAAHGVAEYWVIDANRLVTHVHREPRPEGYAIVNVVATADPLSPLRVPGLTFKLADLDFGWSGDDADT